MKIYTVTVDYLHGGDTKGVEVIGVYRHFEDAEKKMRQLADETRHCYKANLGLTDDEIDSSSCLDKPNCFVHLASKADETYDFINITESKLQ